MIDSILHELQDILTEFLGKPKHDVSSNGQLEFACPHCRELYGEGEDRKYNLSINIMKNKFQCWKCCQYDDEMHGSVLKLIKMYGNSQLLEKYIKIVSDFKKSKLYEIHFSKDDFNIESEEVESIYLKLPKQYKRFDPKGYNPKRALEYLSKRGIGWDIIEEFRMGYTEYDSTDKQISTRIILPSYNQYDELNYWTGRDYSHLPFKQKYYNPQVERKEIVFNENKIQWDADITLCEGPFDHIVVPNSIPLLGKVLKPNFGIYDKIMRKANANVNIFLDGDAFEDVKKIYKLLNQGRLYGKIKYIPTSQELDPSEIYQKWGKKGIIEHLKGATTINEVYLN